MIPPPGYSINDFVEIIGWAKKLWDAYFDDFDNAPYRIQQLGLVIEFVRERLEIFQQLSVKLRGESLGLESIKRILNECEDYFSKNSVLQPGRTEEGSRLSTKFKRVWKTGRFAFDDKPQKLADSLRLALEQLTVLYGELNLAKDVDGDIVGRDVSGRDLSHYLQGEKQTPNTQPLDMTVDEVHRASLNLQAVAYAYKREITNSAVKRTPPDPKRLRAIDEDLRRYWREYWLSAGMSEEQLPEISLQTALDKPKQLRNRAVIESVTSNRGPPTQFKFDSTLLNANNTAYTATFDAHRLSKKRPHPELDDYEIEPRKKDRKIVWSNPRDGLTLRHYVPYSEQSPGQAHPFVLHHDTANSEKERRQVTFIAEKHRLVLQSDSKVLFDALIPEPIYTFTAREYQDHFIGDLRGKILRRFDTEAISSGTTHTAQVLYIWLSRHGDSSQHSFSFYACNSNPQKFLEFPLCWFHAPVERARNNTLELSFLRPPTSHRRKSSAAEEPSSPKQSRLSLSRLARRYSLTKASGADDTDSAARPEPLPTPPSTGPSIQGKSSVSSPSEQASADLSALASEDIVSKYGNLTFRFASRKVLLECKKVLEGAMPPKLSALSLPPPAMVGSQRQESLPVDPLAELKAFIAK